MGFLVALSRFGGIIAPFISLTAPENGIIFLPFLIYMIASLSSAYASHSTMVETTGLRLDEAEKQIEMSKKDKIDIENVHLTEK